MYHYTVSTAILAADGNAEAQNAAPVAPAGGAGCSDRGDAWGDGDWEEELFL